MGGGGEGGCGGGGLGGEEIKYSQSCINGPVYSGHPVYYSHRIWAALV